MSELQRIRGRRVERIVVKVQEPGEEGIIDQDYVFDLGSVNEEASEVLVPIISEVIYVFLSRDELAGQMSKARTGKEQEQLAEQLSKKFGLLVLDKINEVLPKVPKVLNDLVIACSTVYRSANTPYQWGMKLDRIEDESFKRELVSSLDRGFLLECTDIILGLTDGGALLANFQKLLVRVLPKAKVEKEKASGVPHGT